MLESARHDPYDPRLAEAMQILSHELGVSDPAAPEHDVPADSADRQARAAALLAAGEAWLALGDSQRSLEHLDRAREDLDHACRESRDHAWILAQVECGRGRSLKALKRTEEAIAALNAASSWCERHGDPIDELQQSLLSQALHTLEMAYSDRGDHGLALEHIARAVAIRRMLASRDPARHRLALSRSLRNLGNELEAIGRHEDAIQAWREMLALRQEQWRSTPTVVVSLALAQAQDTVARRLIANGRQIEYAVELAIESTERWLNLSRSYPARFFAAFERQLQFLISSADALATSPEPQHCERLIIAVLATCRALAANFLFPDLANLLRTISVKLYRSGSLEQAIRAVEGELEHRRILMSSDGERHLLDFADTLFNQGCFLGAIGRTHEALTAYEAALGHYRERERTDRLAALPGLGRTLNALGLTFKELGRHDEFLRVAHEAVAVRRLLVDSDRAIHLVALVESLDSLGWALDKTGQPQAALRAAQEALALSHDLVGQDRAAHLMALVRSHNNIAHRYDDLGRPKEALEAVQEAVQLARELAALDRGMHLRTLAVTLVNLCIRLADAREPTRAVAAIDEAVDYYRELRLPENSRFQTDYIATLVHQGMRYREAGLHDVATSVFREVAPLLLRCPPTNPYDWCALAVGPTISLNAPDDLLSWHLPRLQQLIEHRELAWESAHANEFLRDQILAVARIWEIVTTLPDGNQAIADVAGATLVSALQSPDLARWLEAHRHEGDLPISLADLKRRVIEAEQRLNGYRARRSDDDQMDARRLPGGTIEGAAAVASQFEKQLAEVIQLRQAFRDERDRVAREDPGFAAAFTLPDVDALRVAAGHADADALLCLLEFEGATDRQVVGILFHADGSPTQRVEFAGLHELCRSEGARDAVLLMGDRRGQLRGYLDSDARPAAEAVPARAAGDLAPELLTNMLSGLLHSMFWKPLQQAIEASGRPIRRLHVCPHGATQQLPLGRRAEADCPGVEIIHWPGLPYLRLAASLAASKVPVGDATTSHPWYIGHDCAWSSTQPLPMVAVEAALLRDLLERHGHAPQAIEQASQLQQQACALVACCHGGAERVQFDHALHLGHDPLTVRQILQERLGPPLALLPACHAGRTDEDTAGNALGVAAAFMLSGTRVVVGSSQAVPDLLQPWLSTLMVWHAVNGMPLHAAATLARDQFGRLAFPEGYRQWLQSALPHALATIQPGGEEDARIIGIRAQAAIDNAARCWPWEGDAQHLFSPDRALRDAATHSVVRGVLRPRDGDQAGELIFDARQMADFTFIYGIDLR